MGKTARSTRSGAGRSSKDNTRSAKPKLVESSDELQLNRQLRLMGLYASSTVGDGNCQFRALSDQLYGTPNLHLSIRSSVCDFLEQKMERYKLFVDEDSVRGGFLGHVGNMRRQGTYGTHIELVAFAHLFRRPIKVIQPGLVYVIESDDQSPTAKEDEDAEVSRELLGDNSFSDEGDKGPIYLVYHSWEHYSSCRNIDGPHDGLPHIREIRIVDLSHDAAQDLLSDEEPNDVDKLVLRSLPKHQARTISIREVRRLIISEGGWESAAELLIANYTAAEQERIRRLQAELAKENMPSPSAAEFEKENYPSPTSLTLALPDVGPQPPPTKVFIKLSSAAIAKRPRSRPSQVPKVVLPASVLEISDKNLTMASTSSLFPGGTLAHPTIDSLRRHRARSISSDESESSPRQIRSRRASPASAASFGSAASTTDASSVSNEDDTPESQAGDRMTESLLTARGDPIEVRETRAATIIREQHELEQKKSSRGPTAREKRDTKRKRKSELKGIKKRVVHDTLLGSDSAVPSVKELYI